MDSARRLPAAWHDASVDDVALAAAIRAGDRNAFRDLVDRESPVVYRSCLRILADPHEAEDVTQEAFVAAYRSIRSYRGDGPLGAWLQRIATRRAFRHAGRRRTLGELREAGDPPDRDETQPLAVALASERARSLRAAVNGLRDPYREAVALRFFGELSLDEIAAATGRPLNTVKTHLRRGLAELRARVGPEPTR